MVLFCSWSDHTFVCPYLTIENIFSRILDTIKLFNKLDYLLNKTFETSCKEQTSLCVANLDSINYLN